MPKALIGNPSRLTQGSIWREMSSDKGCPTQRILEASTDPLKATDLLSSMDQYPLAEKVLLDGLSDTNVQAALRRLQMKEIADFRNERNKQRSRMIIEKSRLIFGVCDPFKVLKEGEVYLRIKALASPVLQVAKARLTDLNPPDVQLHPRAVFVGHLS
ncbi:hypothetical protein K435DRAFT_876581 [Dendrothele bispora CBS 962.96]|uniref:RNA-dependent RNA polymerase n=1 Tax=Dendrothele bispora (strain CBS 962.96) TaxID=1314807 RepID=A0A4V4HB90_DENBC|nr:hypothetical protein K435DRAFT_876581 [Dendrothele bispora CBS 962.96]